MQISQSSRPVSPNLGKNPLEVSTRSSQLRSLSAQRKLQELSQSSTANTKEAAKVAKEQQDATFEKLQRNAAERSEKRQLAAYTGQPRSCLLSPQINKNAIRLAEKREPYDISRPFDHKKVLKYSEQKALDET